VTDEALALAFRTGLPFVGLRDHEPDPDLDRIVPPDAARTARALPLAAEDDHVRLAVADPEADLSALNPYLTGRQVDLALAPREELDAILGPPPVAAAPEPASEDAEADSLAPTATDHEPLPPAPAPGDDEPEPLAADHTAPTETDEPDPLAAAPSGDEPEPLAADHTAPTETDEPDPLAADHTASTETDPLSSEPEPAAAREADEPESVGEAAVEPSGDAGSVGVVAAEPEPPVDDHPELAGELPSWLEPPRRGRRVLLTVLIVIVVLAIAAAVLIAFANA
jgi:hypothetical protein